MRVLRFKQRTHLLVFQISGRKRDVSIRSAVLSAETSNYTLIPALLNLLQRRNSRGPTPPPPGAARPPLISARRTLLFYEIFTSSQAVPWVTVHDETLCTRFGIRDTVTDMTKADRKREVRSIGVSWKPPVRPPRNPERSVFSIYMHCYYLTRVLYEITVPKINFLYNKY